MIPYSEKKYLAEIPVSQVPQNVWGVKLKTERTQGGILLDIVFSTAGADAFGKVGEPQNSEQARSTSAAVHYLIPRRRPFRKFE